MATVNDYIPPEWLTQQFIETALAKYFGRNMHISDYDIKPATNKGDNYLSQIFRVTGTQDSNSKNISIIIKSLPLGEKVLQFVEEAKFFEIERKMLSETMPLIQSILNEAGETQKFYADVYYLQKAPQDLLILEDLKDLGFQPINRLEGLDLPHCLLIMETLAKLHAASLKAIKLDKTIKETYRFPFWSRNSEKNLNGWIIGGLNELLKVLKNLQGLPKDLPEKIKTLQSSIIQNVYETFEYNEAQFNVLIHGDMWINNFMFKYDNGIPTGLSLVDYQICNYNSPVVDIMHFLFTSPKEDVLYHNVDYLLEKYHSKFEEVCKKIDVKVDFSFSDLQKVMKEKMLYGFVLSVTLFPVAITQLKDVRDLNERVNDDGLEVNPVCFQSEIYHSRIKAMLSLCEKCGLFD